MNAGWPLERDPRAGVVSQFEEDRGLGVVTDASGLDFDFHCTAITDGTRSVDVGAAVTFVVRPGRRGRFEAREVEKR